MSDVTLSLAFHADSEEEARTEAAKWGKAERRITGFRVREAERLAGSWIVYVDFDWVGGGSIWDLEVTPA